MSLPQALLLMKLAGCVVLFAPAALLAALGVPTLINRKLSERTVARLVELATSIGLLATLVNLLVMLLTGLRHVTIDFGNWVEVPHYHFTVKFVFDRLSVPFAILSFALCGVIGKFASRYLHREAGYNRFFLFYALFLLGMVVTSLAETIETLFAGWELVGLSSALLVAFYHDRPAPVSNGLRVWIVYRISDAALLSAALAMHHVTGQGDFEKMMGSGAWPLGTVPIDPTQAFLVGLLLLVAAAGKSALIPFSGWLPRAMEGPTPSSAVFYGALSVHLGAFLLLRVSPVLEQSLPLRAAVVTIGLSTAVAAAVTGRVQTDVKSALCYASLTQVGIIVAEIGFGLRYLALVHILGHACLRTLQFVRAPSLLNDYRALEDAIGDRLPLSPDRLERSFSESLRIRLYRFGLERAHLDSLLTDYLVTPVLNVFRACDALERRWTDFLSGGNVRASDRVPPPAATLDDWP